MLAAAPTTPPCFRRWRRSSLLHSGHIQRKNYFIFCNSGKSADFPELPFHGRGRGGKRQLPHLFPSETAARRAAGSPSPSRLTPCHLSQRERLWRNRKLCRYAKGPILEGAVAVGDWGSSGKNPFRHRLRRCHLPQGDGFWRRRQSFRHCHKASPWGSWRA